MFNLKKPSEGCNMFILERRTFQTSVGLFPVDIPQRIGDNRNRW